MSRIRSKDTTPERVVREALRRQGYRYRLHVRVVLPQEEPRRGEAPGRRPRAVSVDILLPGRRVAVFVHGCFWHRHRGCRNCTTPTRRRAWWLAKLEGNAARDRRNQAALRRLGWRCVVVWECQTEKPGLVERVLRRRLGRAQAGPAGRGRR